MPINKVAISIKKKLLEGLPTQYQKDKAGYDNRFAPIRFELFEYGKIKATFRQASYDITMKAKLSDDTVITIVDEKESAYRSSRAYYRLRGEKTNDKGRIYQSILDSLPVRVVIIHGQSRYNFTIEGKAE